MSQTWLTLGSSRSGDYHKSLLHYSSLVTFIPQNEVKKDLVIHSSHCSFAHTLIENLLVARHCARHQGGKNEPGSRISPYGAKVIFQPGPGSKYSLLSFRRELKKGVQGGFGSVHPRGME